MSEIKNDTQAEETVEKEVGQPTETAEKQEEPKKPKKEKEDKKAKAELAALRTELEAKEKELSEEKDKYLRLLAEYDNFRRRSQKEREGIYTDAVSDCLGEFLPLLDNLGRAAEASGDAEQVRVGLEMTKKSADALLEKMGVEAFGEAGDTFDPQLHNAVMHGEDESRGENEISDVFQRGYRRGDRVIRYAMVKVVN
ncbi:MAG: nucleotide exchange factor GrpE [Clostridia bacterium]|nr:nucleotide exchange factor GrpE [Clostridia bacterium]